MIEILKQAYAGVGPNGEIIPNLKDAAQDKDWLMFCHHLLLTAELLDEKYVSKGIVSIGGQSVGNLFNLGMKLYTGAYNENTKMVDQNAYSEAMERMLAVIGISDLHIVPTSFDEGTLYTLLASPVIGINDNYVELDDKGISKGEINFGVNKVNVNMTPQGDIAITINNETAVIREEFGDDITRDYHENGAKTPDSRTIVTVKHYDGTQEEKVLNTKGMVEKILIGGVGVNIKGRLVIEQTNITESLHLSPIVKVGLINKLKPATNDQFIDLLGKAQDIVVMGPGSSATSLMPHLCSEEVVRALLKRRSAGKPIVFVFNPFRDNETVNYTFGMMVKLIETVSGRKFEELFSDAIVDDIVAKARNSIKSTYKNAGRKEGKNAIDDVIDQLKLMNKFKDDNVSASESDKPRLASDFSQLAKLSRGVFGATDDEVNDLIRLLEKAKSTRMDMSDFYQFGNVRAIQNEMAKRGVKLWLKPLSGLREMDPSKAGIQKEIKLEVGYRHEVLGEVIDSILLENSQKSRVYRVLLNLYDNPGTFEMEIQRLMGIFTSFTRHDLLDKMYHWRKLKKWPKGTRLLTKQDVTAMRIPKVIISNAAYTLVWLDGKHRPEDMPKRLSKAMNAYLRQGGVLIAISGFSKETMDDLIVRHIDPELRQRIVIAPSSGAEAWGYDPYGDMSRESFYSYNTTVDQQEKNAWYTLTSQVYYEFGLNEPLYSLTGEKIDDKVPMDEREAQITFEIVARTNLTKGMAKKINDYLEAKGLGNYKIDKTDNNGYYDIRPSIIKRLKDVYRENKLNINIQPFSMGSGALNISLLSPEEAIALLRENNIVEKVSGRTVIEDKDY
ncbi:MAG: 2-phospho-L-lactate transferase CofD family protein, partial [Methanomassiliicoccales archaeon]